MAFWEGGFWRGFCSLLAYFAIFVVIATCHFKKDFGKSGFSKSDFGKNDFCKIALQFFFE
ncbi:hypothetical protein [Helicobacter sp. T3_23-1059]